MASRRREELHTHTTWYICIWIMELAWMNSKCSQNYATRGIGSIPHMLFFLFKVRLNNGVFGGRWLTLTHWCAQRLWLKNGECEWAVGSVFLAQSNMLRPVYWNVSYSDPNSPPAGQLPFVEHLTGAYRLSPGVCQSATLHYTAAFVADDQKSNFTMRERGV